MKLTFYGSCEEVGRSCLLLDAGKKVLLDAGMKINAEGKERFPALPLKLVRKIDAIILLQLRCVLYLRVTVVSFSST